MLFNKLHLSQEVLCPFVESMRLMTVQKLQDWGKDPVSAHNAITHYTLTLMKFGTGHRPVVDPFCYLREIDIEHNRCIISDKVISVRHEYRMVLLSEMVCDQLNRYLAHLKRLKTRLKVSSEPQSLALANAIETMFEGVDQDIPLFFLLESMSAPVVSISPGEQQDYWHQFGQVPVNYGRSFLATELPMKDVSVEQVEALLGHTDGVRHFFGPRSILAPMDFVKNLQKPIDELLTGIGFEAIGPKPRATKKQDETRKKRNRAGKAQYPAKIRVNEHLGPVQRLLERKKKAYQIRDLINGVLKEFIQSKQKVMSKEMKLSFELKVIEKAELSNLSRSAARWQFYEVLKRLKEHKYVIQGFQRQIKLQVEPSPINRKSFAALHEYDNACEIYKSFLNDEEKRVQSDGIEERCALMVMSAALFGGMSQRKSLLSLPALLKESIHREAGVVSLLNDTERWFPDDLTKAFIAGILKIAGRTGEEVMYDERDMENAIHRIINVMGIKKGKRHVMPFLEKMARTCLIFYVPGFVRSGSLRERARKSLPDSAWVRLLRDERLDITLMPQDAKVAEEENEWLPVFKQENFKSKEDIKKFCKDIRKLINNEIKWLENRKARKIKKAKRRLAKAVAKYQENNPSSILGGLVCGWVWQLCKHGPVKKHIAIGTIKKYFSAIAEALLSIADHDTFLDLSDFEYEEIYLRILDYGDKQDKRYRLNRLRTFHDFLMDHYLVENTDWSVLYAEAGVDAKKRDIDANVITHQEYLKCIELCLNDQALPEHRRFHYGMILMLGYRFQLRFGEAIRLLYRDIQHDMEFNEVWVQISGNIYRRVKSRAGVRQVPLMGVLEESEKSIFRRVLLQGEMGFEEDNVVGLLVNPETQGLIERYKASFYINELLRYVTGDDAVRFHHYRHGAITRMIILSSNLNDSDLSQVKEHLKIGINPARHNVFIGEFDDVNNPLVVAADCAGHATELVTLSSYFHLDDLFAKCYLKPRLKWLSLDVIAFALYETYDAVQKRVRRKSEEAGDKIDVAIKSNMAIRRIQKIDLKTISLDDMRGMPVLVKQQSEITPITVHQVLEMICKRNRSVIQVSEGFGIEISRVSEILEKGFFLERTSGFNHYELFDFHRKKLILQSEKYSRTNKINRLHQKRIRKLLPVVTQRLNKLNEQDLEELFIGLNIWARAKHGHKLLFVETEEIKLFLGSISNIEVGEFLYRLEIPVLTRLSESMLIFAQRKGIQVKENIRILSSREKLNAARKTVGALEITCPEGIGTVFTLDALLFMVLLHLNVWRDPPLLFPSIESKNS